MRLRHTILSLAVILSCLTHGSDMAYGQSPALDEAYNRYNTLYQQGRYSEAIPTDVQVRWSVSLSPSASASYILRGKHRRSA